jgi:hypothetical protein
MSTGYRSMEGEWSQCAEEYRLATAMPFALPADVWRILRLRGGYAPRAPCSNTRLMICEVAPPLALRLASSACAPWDMRAGSAPRAPRRGRGTPPNPLQVIPAARSIHRHMPPVCRRLAAIATASYRLKHASVTVTTSIVSCQLTSARRHARQALGIRKYQIGVPRGEALGRECRGRGRPLPPPAQGICVPMATCCGRGSQGRSPGPGVRRARPPSAAARAGHIHYPVQGGDTQKM